MGYSDLTLLQGSQQGQILQELARAGLCSWPETGLESEGHKEGPDFEHLEILNNEQ